MKNYIFLLMLLFCTAAAGAQPSVTIKGVIKGSSSDSIQISYNNSRLIYEPVDYKVKLDDGKFQYAFIPKEDYTAVTIIHKNLTTELLISPGDDLQLTALVNDTSWKVTYTGTGSERANFMSKHAADMGFMATYPGKLQKHFTKDVKAYMKDISYEEDDEMEYLEKHKAGLSPQFIRYLQQTYRYFTYFGLFQYPLMHEVAKANGYNFSSIPPVNYDAVKNIPPVFNDSFISSISYRLYADQYYRMKLEVGGYFNDTAHVFRMQDSAAKLAVSDMPTGTAEYVVALQLYAAMRNIPVEMVKQRLDEFRKKWPNSIYKKDLEAQYAIAKRVAPGEKAYDFTFTTAQGKEAKLSDLKGRVVVLGFWSSMDKRSVMEVNAGGKMAKHYDGQPISFVYVSLDTDDSTWIKTIEKFKLNGIHTRENGVWKSLVAQMYGVQGLPVFYLIDKDGKFVMQQTPLPSQARMILPVVDKLLGIPPSLPSDSTAPPRR